MSVIELMSLPTRGEWIEISPYYEPGGDAVSLPTRGEWIEINCTWATMTEQKRLSPHGESGLKFIIYT